MNMDAIELLESQHEEMLDLFEQIEETEGDDEKLAIFQEIADALAAHATIEERIFYPAAYTGDAKELLQEAVEEHLAAKRTLADLLQMKPSDAQFEAKVTVLKEQLEHHIEEEEDDLFEKVREAMSEEDLKTYGAQMEQLYVELMQGEPRKSVPAEIGEAAPLPD
jgi:hypothetical protein